MTANGTRDSIVARRSLFARANLGREDSGVAADDLRELTLWADISDLKLAGSVLNHYLMKKQPKEKGPGCWSNNKINTL